jgi:hypothetical protein
VEDSAPSCQAPRRRMLKDTLGLSGRLACKAVGLAAAPTAVYYCRGPQPIRTPK